MAKLLHQNMNVNDTRMQVWLQDALKSSGGKVKLSIKFEFKYRNMVLTGWAAKKQGMAGYMKWRNGFPACVSMMIYRDGIHYPTWAPENFIWNMAILNTALLLQQI